MYVEGKAGYRLTGVSTALNLEGKAGAALDVRADR